MTLKRQSAFAANLLDFLGQVWHAVKFGFIPAAVIIGGHVPLSCGHHVGNRPLLHS